MWDWLHHSYFLWSKPNTAEDRALQRASSLSAVRSEFWEAFFSSATFHYTKKCEILARFAQCPGRLVPLLLSHQSQPKIHQQGALLPWITAESSGITVPKVCTRKLLGAVLAGSGMSGINHIVFPHFSRMKHGARRSWGVILMQLCLPVPSQQQGCV